MEVLKCRAQMNKDGYLRYKHEISRMVKLEGFRSLYKGFWPTFWREIPGWGVYFYVYDAYKEYFKDPLTN